MTGMALLRALVWLKRIALALEDLNARDRLRYERDYPPPGVDPPGRRKMVIDKPTAQDRQEMRWKKQEEQMLQGQDEL